MAPPVEPIATVLATASAERGQEVASNCMGCHTVSPADNRHTAGPTLWGVVGRAPASLPGFEYSSALPRLGGVWHEEALNAFVAHPMATAPGTSMQFEGLANAEERAAPAPPWSIKIRLEPGHSGAFAPASGRAVLWARGWERGWDMGTGWEEKGVRFLEASTQHTAALMLKATDRACRGRGQSVAQRPGRSVAPAGCHGRG